MAKEKLKEAGKSLRDVHVSIVDELRARGEPVLGGMEWNGRTLEVPDVYVKGAVYGVHEFVCGCPIREDDGSITVWDDFFAYERRGYSFDQLGLCNPKLWYTTRLLYDEALKARYDEALKPQRKRECRDCASLAVVRASYSDRGEVPVGCRICGEGKKNWEARK